VKKGRGLGREKSKVGEKTKGGQERYSASVWDRGTLSRLVQEGGIFGYMKMHRKGGMIP